MPNTRTNQSSATLGQDAGPWLRVRGVTKRYGVVTALEDVDIDFRAGEVHALLGENGAGKSTLMSIISGAQQPTAGAVEIAGTVVDSLTPTAALEAGISIVHQTPALLPDLTVTENFALAIPGSMRPSVRGMEEWVRERLAVVGSRVHPSTRTGDLPIADRQLIEIAKALATDVKLLILDEPTAPLVQDKVDLLFEQVRRVAAAGVAVVYITHRIPEVREIADTMTILRDGRMRGSYEPENLTDDEIIKLIAGRDVDAVFPPKASAEAVGGSGGLDVRGLSGSRFNDISFTVRPGEIVGLAGVAGNGQVDILRTLAGLERAEGIIAMDGETLSVRSSRQAKQAGIVFMPADRAGEGILADFSIRENSALGALGRFGRHGVIDRSAEREATFTMARDLTVKAPDVETPVGNLSGGNQQKVVLARALLAQPRVILAEEPTQGVDAGARAEIYARLRAAADSGAAIVVLSSDALELEGLCDRVLVVSRGSVTATLTGDDVNEHAMMQAMVLADSSAPSTGTAHADTSRSVRASTVERPPSRLGGSTATLVLAAAILALTLIATVQNTRFIGEANISLILLSTSALAFVALGQMMVVITGGIDLSVGPLTGLVLVVTSFFWNDGVGIGGLLLGLLAAAGVAALVGIVNGTLIRNLGFTAVAATLLTYIAIQGVSLVLRPEIGGYVDFGVLDALNATVGPIPIAFLVVVGVALAIAAALRWTQPGIALRASGSDETIAARLGVRTTVTVTVAYMACSLLTAIGGFMLVGQVGVGDPNQGISFTLSSITAVVVAGVLLRGGSGSPIAVVLGALLLQVILAMANFLRLDTSWMYWLQGGIVLAAAVMYVGIARRGGRSAV